MNNLVKTLTLLRGTGLMLNIVVGAGLLALPGLVVEMVGPQALWSWLFCAAVSIPLLATFTIMGRRYPDAGGIAHFTKKGLGEAGYIIASLIFLGAVVFGLPAIALTGGHYLVELLGGAPTVHGGPTIYGGIIILCAASMMLISPEFAGRISAGIASLILFALLGLVAIGLSDVEWGTIPQKITPITEINIPLMLAPFLMIFFAFTGWEVAAGLSEEFKNPRRDFPRAMILSFAIATMLYLVMVLVVQVADIKGNYVVAFSEIVGAIAGPLGGVAVNIVAVLIIFANLLGAIWAISRMVFSLSREGYLFTQMKTNKNGVPVSSVVLTVIMLLAVLGADSMAFVDINNMLAIAGQNFLILYGFAGVSLLKLSQSTAERCTALSALAVMICLLVVADGLLIYPLGLALLGIIIHKLKSSNAVD